MIRSWISSLRLTTIRSMKSMSFEKARSTPRSWQQVNCQGSTIWFCEKATLRKKIPESLHWQSSTFESSSPPTTKTIQKNQQQHLTPSIRFCQWLGHPLYPSQQPRNEANMLGLQQSRQRNVANQLSSPLPTSK